MASKPISLSLPNNGSTDKVERGKIVIPKGNACKGLRLKMSVPIANTSGGALTLTDAQKQLVLANFLFSLTHGPGGQHQPFIANDGRVIHRAQRTLYGSEIEDYTDTVTGFQQEVANGATDTMVFYLVVPLGYFWRLVKPAQLAFGRSQMRTVELEVRRLGTVVIVAGMVISGTVSIDIMPDLVPCKGDPVSPGIAYMETDDADKRVVLPEGAPILIDERTAIHTGTSLTNISLKIDDLQVHEQVSPAELITESNDIVNYPAEAATTDRTTHLYVVNGQGGTVELGDLPTGRPEVIQNAKDLATIKLSMLYIPVTSAEQVNAMLEHAAGKSMRSKKLRAVSMNVTDGLRLGSHVAFAAPYRLVDEDTDEFERFPGPVAAPGEKAQVAIPSSVLAAAKQRIAAHESRGEFKAARNAEAELAAAIPGAIQSARGFKRGDTSILARVRRELA